MLLLIFITILLSTYAIEAGSLLIQGIRASSKSSAVKERSTERDMDGGRCLDCICQTESNCNQTEGCSVGIYGEACGPYHINQTYFKDCCSLLGMSNCGSDSAWRSCTKDFNCATRCVQVSPKDEAYKMHILQKMISKLCSQLFRHIWTSTLDLVLCRNILHVMLTRESTMEDPWVVETLAPSVIGRTSSAATVV